MACLKRWWLTTIAVWLVVAVGGQAQAPATKTETIELVKVQRGTMPVILSAPHGGRLMIPDVPERKGEGLPKGSSGFSVAFDSETDLLLVELADAIEKRTGKKPYFVYAKFSRRYADCNRPPEIAYESPNAKPVYDQYHETLATYCKEVQKTWGAGLLLDIHGQGTAKDTIFRGTQNGKTVKLLRDRFGEKAHIGGKSFFGLLAANEIKTHPDPLDGLEASGFSGGFITRNYGADGAHGVDAIQLECGYDYRDPKKVKDAAKRIAKTIDEFSELYLPRKKRDDND